MFYICQFNRAIQALSYFNTFINALRIIKKILVKYKTRLTKKCVNRNVIFCKRNYGKVFGISFFADKCIAMEIGKSV